MSSVKVEAYARALFEIAQAEGTLDRVEDELFRVARAFESNEQLRATLTDNTIPTERRQLVAEQLLGGKASDTTTQLVSLVVNSGQVRELPAIIDSLVKRASSEKAARSCRDPQRNCAQRRSANTPCCSVSKSDGQARQLESCC